MRSPLCLALASALFGAILSVSGDNAMAEDCNIRDFGAVGDGATLDTAAIQKALDTCAQKGGGTVRVPAGTFKAGTLHLRSRVTLRLERGATLLQSRDLKDYTEAGKESYAHGTGSHHVFLHGVEVKDVRIEGEGKIDGNKGDVKVGRDPRGPLSILFENSADIVVKDVTVVNSPGWSVTFFGCRHVRILHVKCLKSFADGINPTCCQDVLYDGVLVDGSGDDAITVKNECRGQPPPCGFLTEDITVRNTTVRNTGHPAVKIGTGTWGVFRDIVVKDCVFENVGAAFTIQLMRKDRDAASERAIEDIRLSNIIVKNVRRPFDITTLDLTRPIIRNISVDHFTAEGVSQPSYIYGLNDAPIRDVRFSHMKFVAAGKKPLPCWLKARHVNGLKLHHVEVRLSDRVESGLVCENAKALVMDEVDLKGAMTPGPAVKLSQVHDALIRKCRAPDVETFLLAGGDRTRGIRMERNDIGRVKTPLDVGPKVAPGAVSPEAERVSVDSLRVSEGIKANEPFRATVGLTNAGDAGVCKVDVLVDDEPAGSKWVWLREDEAREVVVCTRPYYKAGRYTIKVGDRTTKAEVEPASAAFELGDTLKICSPAAAGELTTVTVPVKNIGGQEGAKKVELRADGRVVASAEATLGPGEEKEIILEHRFADAGPHKLQVGDFPVWPFATFANTESAFYQTRDGRIIIEANGGARFIWAKNRQYAAVYLPKVRGDFLAAAKLLGQTVTGRYGGGGLIVKNDMANAEDSSGLALAWYGPKYNVAGGGGPRDFRIEKKQKTFTGTTRTVAPDEAAAAQDVGLFVTAFSQRGERCRAEFRSFSVEPAQ